PITSVEYSIDGGIVWSEAVIWEVEGSIARWQFDFLPKQEGEFELQIRAKNERGAVGNPEMFGPWTIKFWDATYEQIAQAFIDAFITALESGGLTEIENLISDVYDGSLGGYFSKDELLEALIHFFGTGEDIDITAVLESLSQGSIIATTSWSGTVGGQGLGGTTTWWLSEDVDFMLVHADGDWFIDLQEGITLEVLEGAGACGDRVKVLLTVPDVPLNVDTVCVEVETDCDTYQIPLDRTYFYSERGVNTGFGGEFPVERTRCTLMPVCTDPNLVQYDENGLSAVVSYDDYDYSISDSIALPEDEISLDLELDDGGFPCNNMVEIFVTEPSLRRGGYGTVDVALSTGSCDYIGSFTLDASYYDSHMTPGMGFGGAVTVEMDATCAASHTCSAPVISYNASNSDLEVTFTDPLSGDTLFESIALPDEDASLELDLIEGGFPCNNRVEILLTKPSLVPGFPTVSVELWTGCDYYGLLSLNQAYYNARMTPGMGYGGEITVEHNACSGTTCTAPVIAYDSTNNELDVTFEDIFTGEVLNEWIELPNPLVPATVWFVEHDQGIGVCDDIEVFMRAPSVDAAISTVDVEISTTSGGSGTYTLTRAYFDAYAGYPSGEGFGERIIIENNTGWFGPGCCGGIIYHNSDALYFLYDGSSDGNAYYVTATKTGLRLQDPLSMTLTQINTGLSTPCDVGVRIMYTLPAFNDCTSMTDYTVALENGCGDFDSVTLTRSYYESHGGAYMVGFGGEIVVEPVTCGGSPTCSPDFTYNPGGSIVVRDSAFGVVESITLP
ncbi:MAG: hypothetical protein JW885_02090, partial [Deltaproteobacteria bacterium]|nr:hypothetical protein [Candidatus Zymogenaceae bacterium]